MKWNPGSAGEKEAKEFKIVAFVFGLITVMILLTLFVFDNELRANVKATAGVWNVIGGVLVLGSLAPIYGAYRSTEGIRGYSIAWLVMLGLGIFISCGFFGNTY